MEEPPEPGPFGPPEARFRLASAWTGWDLTGSQAIHPVPLPGSKTPAESVVPHQSGPTAAAPAPPTTQASAVTWSRGCHRASAPAAYASHATLPPPAQGSLPAGWLAFAGRGSNSPDRDERIQSVLTSSSFPGLTLSQAGFTHQTRLFLMADLWLLAKEPAHSHQK